jgi:hypothetical protein
MAVAAISATRTVAQVSSTSDDPLRHGHALLIGNSHYADRRWSQLDDIPLQLEALRKGLLRHFDSVKVEQDLDADQLRQKINGFVRTYENDNNARLFIYYAGHGYTELIRERNEYRGYITGIDTPPIDSTQQGYDAARRKAISMTELSASLDEALAKSILFIFDSCFAGTIFSVRAGNVPQRPLIPEVVARLIEKPTRDFITAGSANEPVPAHSPIPELLMVALDGAAERYQHGVISDLDVYTYLQDQILSRQDIKLTPQYGRSRNPVFAEGAFLFRVINPAIGVANENKTIRLYRADTEKGNARAQFELAWLYDTGEGGVPKDEREATRLYKLSADQGYAPAQANLGVNYRDGVGGVSQDDREAARLFKLAADQGDAGAQANLGFF